MFFDFDQGYYHYYPNLVNDKIFVGQEEADFIVDGYHIRKLSQLKKVRIKDDKCNEINRLNGVIHGVCTPELDISSWQSIFEGLKALNTIIIVEDENNKEFFIGEIMKAGKSKVHLRIFDADGIWQENQEVVPYSSITKVSWKTRYAENWEKYLKNQF